MELLKGPTLQRAISDKLSRVKPVSPKKGFDQTAYFVDRDGSSVRIIAEDGSDQEKHNYFVHRHARYFGLCRADLEDDEADDHVLESTGVIKVRHIRNDHNQLSSVYVVPDFSKNV